MRLYQITILPDTRLLLEVSAQRYGMVDMFFVEDLFCLCAKQGNDLPDSGKIDTIAKNYALANKRNPQLISMMMKKRSATLKQITTTSLFKGALMTKRHPVSMVDDLLLQFRELHAKLRASQCMTCQFYTMCQFGQQYGQAVADIRAVPDPDYSKKVHDDCPARPDMDLAAMMSKGAAFLNDLATQAGMNGLMANAADPKQTNDPEELTKNDVLKQQKAEQAAQAAAEQMDDDHDPEAVEEADKAGIQAPKGQANSNNAGKTSQFRAGFSNSQMTRTNNSFVEKLSVGNLVLYQIARHFEAALEEKAGEFEPVDHLEKKTKERTIRGMEEASKVHRHEHAMDEEVFDAKLIKKQLGRTEYQKPKSKKQLLYVLLDVSGSMGAPLGVNVNYLTRSNLAAAFTMALCRRVKKDGGMLFFRPFEGQPGPLREARLDHEFTRLESLIAISDFDGGGTSFYNALEAAFKDIQNGQDEIARAEILLITDGCDNFDVPKILQMKQKTEINVLDISGMGPTHYQNGDLFKVADRYYYADTNAGIDVNKIVTLVGGKAPRTGGAKQ